jgi:hypothetical protein
MLSHLSLGALAVAGAAAFMIPPNVALESASKSAIPNMVTDPFSMKLLVPCKGCPYAEFNDKGMVWTELDNSLFLDVAVNHKLDTVELNGVQIYPPQIPASLKLNPEVARIAQIPSTVSLNAIESNRKLYLAHPLTLTSFGLEATTVHSLKETGEEIIKIRLSINALEGKAINMPNIVITALKNPEIHLMVLNVELQEPQEVSKGCHGLPLMCKWKNVLGNMVNSLRGKLRGKCHKSRPHKISAEEQHKKEEQEKPKHHSHDKSNRKGHHKDQHKVHHKGHHHGHHRHHHRLHRFLHKAASILLTIVIPLLLGILAGMLTYTVGMLLGTVIALVWIRVRSMRNNYQPIALDDEEEPRESFDKDEFVEAVYVEAPPMYVEVEAKEVARQE